MTRTPVAGAGAERARSRAPQRPPRPPRFDIADGVPICGFTGVNGAGKTTLAVESALRDMALGRTVYSTVQIHSPWGDSVPISSLRQLLELHDATVLLDEVSVIFSSRSSQSLPPEVVAFLQTLRHRRVTVRWTAPAWMRCDNLLREVTQAVVNVVPLLRRRSTGTPWPSPRVIMAGLLDTSAGKADATPDRVLRRRFLLPSRLNAWGTFDTHADTPLLGRHLQAGRCPDCGGSREIPKHSKARHDELGLPWYEEELHLAVAAERPAPGAAILGPQPLQVVLPHPPAHRPPYHFVEQPEPDTDDYEPDEEGYDEAYQAAREDLSDVHDGRLGPVW